MTTPIVLRVAAGPHERRHCPVWYTLEGESDEPWSLVREPSRRGVPCQATRDAGRVHLCWILPPMRAGSELVFRLTPGGRSRRPPARVAWERLSGDRLRVRARREELATFHFGRRWPRPFWNPLRAPGGAAITRPLFPDPADPEAEDAWQRGLWIGHSDVGGIDNWRDGPPGHGWTRLAGPPQFHDGPVHADLTTTCHWLAADDRTVLAEERTRAIVYDAAPEYRLLDLRVRIQATAGPVTLGAMGEGGVVSLRLAVPLEPRQGGRLSSSLGGVGVAECTRVPGQWCDSSAVVGGRWLGVSIFEHPGSLRAPSLWSATSAGLLAPNPFAPRAPEAAGDAVRLAAGSTAEFRYRICLHLANSTRGRVADRYIDYAFPPEVQAL
jgi:hypothetical protein